MWASSLSAVGQYCSINLQNNIEYGSLSAYMTILGGSRIFLKTSLAIEASAHSELYYIQSFNPPKLTKDQIRCKIILFFFIYYSSMLGLTILSREKTAMILRRKWRLFFKALLRGVSKIGHFKNDWLKQMAIVLVCFNWLGKLGAAQKYWFPFRGRTGQVPGLVLELLTVALALSGISRTRPPPCCQGCWGLSLVFSSFRNYLLSLRNLKPRPDLWGKTKHPVMASAWFFQYSSVQKARSCCVWSSRVLKTLAYLWT